jgi:hypothetical protein
VSQDELTKVMHELDVDERHVLRWDEVVTEYTHIPKGNIIEAWRYAFPCCALASREARRGVSRAGAVSPQVARDAEASHGARPPCCAGLRVVL